MQTQQQQRRQLTLLLGLAVLPLMSQRAFALSEGDAASGIRTALERGAVAAVGLLGKPDGFLGNPLVRIELPGYLKDGAKLLKATGQGKRVDELLTAMNRAAEAAVPEAKSLLVAAVKNMSVEDGVQILRGGDDAATRFFETKTRTPLSAKFLPIVTRATERVALADKYNAVAGKAAGLGLVRGEDANIQQYVTGKALDGLFLMIGEEEKKIRKDPVGTGSSILKKVFGGL
ncbi:DUF4197 domain-containing protein [Roseateles sp. DAIF2]|uniref:DUF4197 domain-containing protein n=1 Tax=Roseateles sp. DAIF2 TaxID=2714952 RepID=UPI0018A25E52|nr:DUF4197 domain-containing protein [Roseateles sp. DAIF2]QPF71939.1 DUF4197 domain-containing protein [Roseateles sp. DAIF2]